VAQSEVFGELLEAMPDAVIVSDESGRIVFANRHAERLSGYSRHELEGHRIEMLVPERFRSGHESNRADYLASEPAARPMGTGLDIRFRRKDGSEFPADIALSPLQTPEGVQVFASIRDISERQRARERLESVLEILDGILRGRETEEVLSLVAQRALQLAGAELATIAVPSGADMMRIRVAEGTGAAGLRGIELEMTGSLAGAVLRDGRPAVVGDARDDGRADRESVRIGDIGPILVVPLIAAEKPFGTLTLANHPGGRQFDDQDLQTVLLFAAQASVALEYARIREELQRLAVMEDRERIGRELHDGAIQALFAVGMGLQGAAAMTADSALHHRLEAAVTQIDGVIRDLRNYIFGLRPGILADRALDQALRHLAEEMEEKSGVTTVVDIDPRVGARLSAQANDVVQLAGEALSNVARHAGATTCRVTLATDDGRAILEVEDDGSGFDPARRRGGGQGLRNLGDRAKQLGGEMEIESVRGEGTTIRFRIPL
jgi:PAS domain S-box-containing protein